MIIAISAAFLLVFSLGIAAVLFGHFLNRRPMQQMQALGIIVGPNLKPLDRFPQPNLQVDDDRGQMTALISRQTEQLDSYGWVNRSNGVIHIPIERAMDLLLERGLPARTNGHPQTDGSPLQLIQKRADER